MSKSKPTTNGIAQVGLAGKARSVATQKAHQKKLNQMPVLMPVKNSKDAKSVKVLNFCREFLTNGGRWDELRRSLGLGPAHLDKRWRIIRELMPELMAPVSEQDALTRMMANQLYMMNELEGILCQAEVAYSSSHYDERELDDDGNRVKTGRKLPGKNTHHYLKLKLEAVKSKFDENYREFEAFIETKKLKVAEKKNSGVSILVQYINQVKRPGDNQPVIEGKAEKIE